MAIINITKEIFEEQILKASQPVLVDFWAPWCMPCRMVGSILEEIAKERSVGAKPKEEILAMM